MRVRIILAVLFVFLCVVDNIFTYEITRWPIYQEVGPVAVLMLLVPYGLWIQKIAVCLALYYFREKITNEFLCILNIAMMLVVCSNGYLYCRIMF